MTTTLETPGSLASVITWALARRIIYGLYVVGAVALGAVQVGYSTLGGSAPSWLSVTVAVFAYLAIPIGSLALVNVTPTARVEVTADVTPATEALDRFRAGH